MSGDERSAGPEERRLVEVVLPQLGETVAEGTVTEWLKSPGDPVRADEPLCEISTDKVNSDLPSPVAGEVAELLVEEGETVEVGTVVARIATRAVAAGGEAGGGEADEPAAGDRLHFEDSSISLWGGGGADGAAAVEGEGEAGGDGPGGAEAGADAVEKAVPDAGDADRSRRHSPAVRALARREGVDLEQVEGTGRGGRVTREDVERHLGGRDARAGGAGAPPEDLEATGGAGRPAAADQAAGRREPLSPVRRVIAERLSESKSTIPHSTTVMEADLTRVTGLREQERTAFEARENVPLTYLPFVAHATVRALEEHPKMNAVLEDGDIRFRPNVNFGIAVATEEGLLVPVVHGADGLGFAELARAMRDAAAGARGGRLRPDDVQGGTFTLTNHGRGGSLWGTPIIVPGQTGILGLGRIRDVPVLVDGEVEARTTCYLSLSFDHRTVDGAEADAFLRSIVERLATFDLGIVESGP